MTNNKLKKLFLATSVLSFFITIGSSDAMASAEVGGDFHARVVGATLNGRLRSDVSAALIRLNRIRGDRELGLILQNAINNPESVTTTPGGVIDTTNGFNIISAADPANGERSIILGETPFSFHRGQRLPQVSSLTRVVRDSDDGQNNRRTTQTTTQSSTQNLPIYALGGSRVFFGPNPSNDSDSDSDSEYSDSDDGQNQDYNRGTLPTGNFNFFGSPRERMIKNSRHAFSFAKSFIEGAHQALTSISSSIGHRLSSVAASGDDGRMGGNVWAKGFGGTASKKGTDSFKSTHIGATIGIDAEILDDKLILGVAYTKAALSSKITGFDKKIGSCAGVASIYGRYSLTDSIYTSGIASIASIKSKLSKSKKQLTTTAVKFEANLGAIMKLDNGIFISPKVGIEHYKVDSAPMIFSGTPIKTSAIKNKKTICNGSVSVGTNHTVSDITFTPEIHAGISQVISGDKNKGTVYFYDYPVFEVSSLYPKDSKSKTTYNLGASVKVAGTSSVSMDLGYDCRLKKKYIAHSGFMKFSWKF